jgi:protein-disulfide isomerase
MRSQSVRTLFVLFALLTTASAQSEPDVLAVVGGEDVTRAEVFEAAADDLRELDATEPRPESYRRDRLEILWNALDSIVEERLIELEAASFGFTVEEMLYIEVDSNIVTPTDGEVEAFYEANFDQMPLPREEALPQVRQYLLDQSKAQFRRPMIQRYEQKFGVTKFLDPLRTDVATAGFPSRGLDDAPVTIVEFGDFECPFCGNLFSTMERVREIYPDEVRIVFRHYPLRNLHPRAQQAAEAAICAQDQGSFWEYHDSLYGNQRALEVSDLKRRAADLGLDTATFNTCLDSGRKYDFVQRDVDDGRGAGVTGTPTLFINGRFMSGPAPRQIQTVIEDELTRSGLR